MARRRKLSPEPFEVRIDTLDDEGFGLAEAGGRVLRVRDALPGEMVSARHLFGRRFHGQAQTLEVLRPASGRVEPRCPHFGTCGSCSLQHMGPDAQLDFKQNVLLRHLARAGLEPRRLLPPLAGEAWHYRRKARLSVREVAGKGRVLVGFRERDGRFVTDMEECHTLFSPAARALAQLAAALDSLDARRAVPQVEVTCGDERCALVIRHLQPLSQHDRETLTVFGGRNGLDLYLQPAGPDSLQFLCGEGTLEYGLPDESLCFSIQPMDFIQVNGSLNRLMVAQAMRELDLQPGHRALDLFCGMGNFTLPMARRCRQVVGLESDAGLVARARGNAERNDIQNTRFREVDLYSDPVTGLGSDGDADRALLDPPRSGARPVLEPLAGGGAQRVVYVSCNPVSLAADAARLVGRHGYALDAAGIMDMFPQTSHVEAMAVFVRD